MDLLQKGPVVLVEQSKEGKFDKATAVIKVDRSPEDVWKAASNFALYKEFMPKVLKSDTQVLGDGRVDVGYEIDTPITNTKYTFRYELDPARKTMKANWVKGDVKGSFCSWRIVPYQAGTLIYYTTASRNFSSLAEKLEDDQQTVTVGVNVAAALAVVKAMKKHIEATTPAPVPAPATATTTLTPPASPEIKGPSGMRRGATADHPGMRGQVWKRAH